MYLLDANAFMEASRLYYGFDLAPAFWKWLVSPAMQSQLCSIEAVKEEIGKGTGDLVEWAEAAPADFWRPVSEASLERASALAEWASDPDHSYTPTAVDEFLGKADFWLVAEGMAGRDVVVTREGSAPESKKRIMIPDACREFGVTCEQPFTVYRTLGLRLGG